MTARLLFELLDHAARVRPDHTAVTDSTGNTVTYRELQLSAQRLGAQLTSMGLGPGDRVGVCMRKSIEAVTCIFGILRAGAAYVPTDVEAPPHRTAFILGDCGVSAAFVDSSVIAAIRAEVEDSPSGPELFSVDVAGDSTSVTEGLGPLKDASGSHLSRPSPDSLAYILYTSGSTGKPKGVALSHLAAISFVDWCSETFNPSRDERFSSHAPFHFDLSILDLYLPMKHGATVVLIGEAEKKDPAALASLMADSNITSWYSTPSTLTLLLQYGKLHRHDLKALRRVLFAGEVMPVKHLRELKVLLQSPRYFNLYGPTETNVCTYFEIPETIPPERTDPYPIGVTCSHLRTRVVTAHQSDCKRGEEGELCVSGPAVMRGYWNRPEDDDRVFFQDDSGEKWYRTGDLVREGSGGAYEFLGRRDRMVKRRGYRVELGEIEAALYRHPEVREAAVVSTMDDLHGIRLHACLSTKSQRPLSIIRLKEFCSRLLPAYMVPDYFVFLDAMKLTSTGKVDYQHLERQLESPPPVHLSQGKTTLS